MSDGGIKTGEWLAELERLNALPDQGEGWTRAELSDRLGLGSERTYRFLHAGVKAGCIVATRAMRPNIVGIRTRTVLYSLTPKGA